LCHRVPVADRHAIAAAALKANRTVYQLAAEEIAQVRVSATRRSNRRDWEGYTPGMMLTEFRLLRRVVAQIVQENLSTC
jgi:hypothetical protein